jgi:chorismate dehydratase
MRIGAVTYLNSRPLVEALPRLAPEADVVFDLPSRLADALAGGRLDVALIPSIEYARNPGYAIFSDACVSSDGPVHSVKLYGRVPPEQISTLALDEGSRTSAALSRILLKERLGLEPELRELPIGSSLEQSTADATVVIGDRGMRSPPGRFAFVWDLGEQWSRWTGLPFVFSMWVGRRDVGLDGVADLLAAARDDGLARLAEIAAQAALELDLPEHECLEYLRDQLSFHLGRRQQKGLARFYELAGHCGLAPRGVELAFFDSKVA